MKDLNNFTTGDTLTAADFVIPMSEVQNVVEGTGQTLSAGDLNQLGKAIADYVSNGNFYTDSGTANSYVLSPLGSKQSPTSYEDGMTIVFVGGNFNTSASTVNVGGLGVKNLKKSDSSTDLVSGDVRDDVKNTFIYDSTSGNFLEHNEVFRKEYKSTGQSMSSGGLITLAHGLSYEPKVINFVIQCTTADGGYSIGDRVLVTPVANSSNSTSGSHGIYFDATNIYIRISSSVSFGIGNKSTGASHYISLSSWDLYVNAYI